MTNDERITEWRRRYTWHTGILPSTTQYYMQRSRGIDWDCRVDSIQFERGKLATSVSGYLPLMPYRGKNQ